MGMENVYTQNGEDQLNINNGQDTCAECKRKRENFLPVLYDSKYEV